MAVNCDTFKDKINLYMDSELNPIEREEMEKHARDCAACGLLLDQATSLATMCAEMNENLTVPLAAQSAWRKAVRAEAAQKKGAPISAWTRGLAAVAAALVVLVTGTYGMREAQPVSDYLPASGAVPASEVAWDVNDSTSSLAIGNSSAVYSLRADGKEESAKTRSLSTEDAAPESVLLRSARREIRSAAYDDDCMWLDNLVSEYDAYYEEHTALTAQDSNGRILNAVICVPGEQLDAFLMELDQLGETTLQSTSLKDVTAQYRSAQAHVNALTGQEARLNELLETAASTEDVLSIEKQLIDVRAQLQALTADSIIYSRVTLTLTEATAETAPSGEAASLAERMKQGFDGSVEWLSHFGEDALVALATAAPRLVVWIPALVLALIVLKLIFRRRK